MQPQVFENPIISIRPSKCRINLKYPPGQESFYYHLVMNNNPEEEILVSDNDANEYQDSPIEEHFIENEDTNVNTIELSPDEDEYQSTIELIPETDEEYQESLVLDQNDNCEDDAKSALICLVDDSHDLEIEIATDEEFSENIDFRSELESSLHDLSEDEQKNDNELTEESLNLLGVTPALYWQYPYDGSDFLYWLNN